MRPASALLGLTAILAFSPLVRGAGHMDRGSANGGTFLSPDSPAVLKALPAPPAPGSLAAMADLEAVLQVQAGRTPADVGWARRIENFDYFAFADVLGPWFNKENLPGLARFLEQVEDDRDAFSKQVKRLYARPRPPLVDPKVHPCVGVPKTYSYPSGHAFAATTWSLVLAEIFPEYRTQLIAFGRRAAWARIIGGVHFPTDDLGGRLIGEAFVAELLKNPEVQAAIARIRAEAAPYLASVRRKAA